MAMLELEDGHESIEALWVHLEGEGQPQQLPSTEQGLMDSKRDLTKGVVTVVAAAALNPIDSPDHQRSGCAGLAQVCPAGMR